MPPHPHPPNTHTRTLCTGKGASGRSTHLGDQGADGGALGPSLHRGELPPPLLGGRELGSCLQPLHQGSHNGGGNGGLCFHSLETIQTGSELGGSPHFRGSGWPTQPRQGDGGSCGGTGHSVGKGDSPRHSCRNLGRQVWPVATAHHPSPTWAVRSAPCPVPLPGGWGVVVGGGVHLMPLEPPGNSAASVSRAEVCQRCPETGGQQAGGGSRTQTPPAQPPGTRVRDNELARPERRGRSWGRGGLGTRRLGGGVQGGGPAISRGSKWGWHWAGCGGHKGLPEEGPRGAGPRAERAAPGAGGTLALRLRLQQDAPTRGPRLAPGQV